jgi:asparagine synthase (glutamine-hydrolysing)
MSLIVPKAIMKRKKQRFFVPIDKWFEGEMGEIVRQMFSEKNVNERGYFKFSYIDKIIKNHEKSKLFYSRQMWNLLNFEMWHRAFIDAGRIGKSAPSADKILNG